VRRAVGGVVPGISVARERLPSWPRNPAGSGRGGDFRLGVLFLPDYDSFAPSDGALTKTRLKIAEPAILEHHRHRIRRHLRREQLRQRAGGDVDLEPNSAR
jgi:hypothetical protein